MHVGHTPTLAITGTGLADTQRISNQDICQADVGVTGTSTPVPLTAVNAPTLVDAVLVTDNTAVAFERKSLCVSTETSGADFSFSPTYSFRVAELLTVDSSTPHFPGLWC